MNCKVFGDRAERGDREKRQRADKHNRRKQHHAERAVLDTQRAGRLRGGLFAASEPAMASGRMMGMNRASSMTMPVATFQGTVLSPRPSKPEPLFALAELNS